MKLERLRCGVITTEGFRLFLTRWHGETAEANFGLVPQLDYVRCASGGRAGQAWIALLWQPLKGIQPHEIFEIAGIKVYLPKGTRTALRERCLDAAGDRILVR